MTGPGEGGGFTVSSITVANTDDSVYGIYGHSTGSLSDMSDIGAVQFDSALPTFGSKS